MIGATNQIFGQGIYYWRLTDGRTPISRVTRFTVAEVIPISLKKLSRDTHGRLHARWDPPQERSPLRSASHRLQISTTPDFHSIEDDSEIIAEAGKAVMTYVPAMRLYGRIRSRLSDDDFDSGILAEIEAGASEQILAGASKKSDSVTEDQPGGHPEKAEARLLGVSQTPARVPGSLDPSAVKDNGEVPPQISQANRQDLHPERVALQYEIQDTNLLLSWAYPSDPDHWEVWTVGNNGLPKDLLVPKVVGTSRTTTLPLTSLTPGVLLMVVGKPKDLPGSSDILSTIVQFSLAAPRPPDTFKIPMVQLGWWGIPGPGSESGVCENPGPEHVVLTWTQNQLVESYFIQIFREASTKPVLTYLVEGSQTQVVLTPYFLLGGGPNIRAEIQAVNAGLKSSPAVAWYCMGDVNGDGVIDSADLDIVAPSPQQLPRGNLQLPPDPSYVSHYPGDVDWNGAIDKKDRCNVLRFMGGKCSSGR